MSPAPFALTIIQSGEAASSQFGRQQHAAHVQRSRSPGIHDIVLRSISGHLTETMQERYSTAQQQERRSAVGKVIEIATARQIRRRRAKKRL